MTPEVAGAAACLPVRRHCRAGDLGSLGDQPAQARPVGRRHGRLRLLVTAAMLMISLTLAPDVAQAYEVVIDPTTLSSEGITFSGTDDTVIAGEVRHDSRGYVASDYSPEMPADARAMSLRVMMPGCESQVGTGGDGLCADKGTLTINFPTPVVDPVLHFAGIGGNNYLNSGELSWVQAHLTLTSPGSLTKLAGSNLTVAGNTIHPTAPRSATGCASTFSSLFEADATAGCGSVRVNGTHSSITFSTALLFTPQDGGPGHCCETIGDLFTVSVSLSEDFGDAPASYDAGNAARHRATDLRFGAGASADRDGPGASDRNQTSSPNTGPGADGDADDASPTFPPLLVGANPGYSVTVPVSGATVSDALACAWIDFDRNGAFHATDEQACVSVPSGGTSATFTWPSPPMVPAASGATPPASTYSRFRIAYDSAEIVDSPNGPARSGEVEDYLLRLDFQ